MGSDQNLRELSKNVISHFAICENCELRERRFSLYRYIIDFE